MGIAASAARYLLLVARQSDCEYQGLQIQQSLLDLSKQTSKFTTQQAQLEVPTPPSEADYTTIQYYYDYTTGPDDAPQEHRCNVTKWVKNETSEPYGYYVEFNIDNGATANGTATIKFADTGRLDSITWITGGPDTDQHKLTSISNFDQEGFDNAFEDYKYKQERYEKAYADIQLHLSAINNQDKLLEMQLNQLDIERTALKTEVESVQKMVKENVERSFKTFGN